MDYSKKQKELDVKKWVDSETKNYDTCGEYSYCTNCNKNEAYPCACAYEKYTTMTKAAKILATPKTTKTLRTTCAKKSTKKTTACSKTTTKKATSTKSSTKKTTAKA